MYSTIIKNRKITVLVLAMITAQSPAQGETAQEGSKFELEAYDKVVSKRTITLKSIINNKFVCDELLNVFGNFYANRDNAGGWETFDLMTLDNGKVVFYSHGSPNYLSFIRYYSTNPSAGTPFGSSVPSYGCSTPFGSSVPICGNDRGNNGTNASYSDTLGKSGYFEDAARFYRIDNGDGTVSFWSELYGKYLSVNTADNGLIAATTSSITAAEKFYEMEK